MIERFSLRFTFFVYEGVSQPNLSYATERFKQGVAIEEIAAAVNFKHDSWSMRGFHIAIGSYLDKKKYVTRRILVDGKPETHIFDK